MSARLYLTVYADDDLPTETAHIASKSLGTVTACTELTFTKHLHGTDALKLKINRHHSQAALLVADRYVIIHSDAGPIGGAFLEEAPIDLSAAEGPGDEWMAWSGRGPMSVLERGVMDNTTAFAQGDDPIDGFWDLSAQGNFAGASNGHPIPMMKRVMDEINGNSPDAFSMVDHSGWDYDEDSSGATPDFLGHIIYGANVGDDALHLAADMSQIGGVTWSMSHLLKFDGYMSYGTDRTGAFGASGKVRFEKGVNIADAIHRTVRGSVQRTHLIVGGADRTYVTVTDPDYSSGDVIRWGFLSMPETADVPTLTGAGLAHIEARKKQTDVWSFPQHDHGDDITNGVYEPAPPGTSGTHYWVGDSVTLHSGTGLYDANELAAPIGAITWQLKTGEEANGDYWVIPQVGATFDWPPAGPGQQHVPPAPPSGPSTAGQCLNSDATLKYGSVGGGGNSPYKAFDCSDATWYGSSAAIAEHQYLARDYGASVTSTRWRILQSDNPSFNASQLSIYGTNNDATWALVSGSPYNFGAAGWTEVADVALTAGENSGTYASASFRYWAFAPTSGGGGGANGWAAFSIEIGESDGDTTQPPGEPTTGTPGTYAPVDHVHPPGTETNADPTVDDDSSEGFTEGSIWVNTTTNIAYILVDDTEGAAVWTEIGSGGSGVTDHGALTGLADDDHPQYLLTTEGEQGKVQAHGAMGATETFDPTDGNLHTGTLDANCTFTLGAPPSTRDGSASYAIIELAITGDGTNTWTWPGSVEWAGTVPDPPGDGELVRIVLETWDGGTTWYGAAVGAGGTTTSSALWVPVTTYDGTNWMLAVDGDGNAIMTEAP